MRRIAGWLALSLLAGTNISNAQDSLQDYAYRLPLSLNGESAWYRVELPMAAYFSAQHGDLRDLRIFNALGQPQAYALLHERSATRSEQQLHTVRMFPLSGPRHATPAPRFRVAASGAATTILEIDNATPAAPGNIRRGWLLDTSTIQAPLEQLQLEWTAGVDGFQRFTIEASDDLQRWRNWGDGQIAHLSLGNEQIRQQHIELPAKTARYLRLLWTSPKEAPLLEAATISSRQQSHSPAPLVWSEPITAQRSPEGYYLWSLPTALPLERLRLPLAQANTLAPITVQARNSDQRPWQTLTRGLLYRLPMDGTDMLAEELTLPGNAVRQLRIQVDQRGGGIGQDLPQLHVAVRAAQVVFLAREAPPYQLALGNASAQSAALPISTLIPGYTSDRLDSLPQAQVQNPIAINPARDMRDKGSPSISADKSDWKRWSLWGVLVFGVALLALMAWSLIRRSLEKMSAE
ncbi:DUF3999 domain-containing protein [Comamonas sp. NoAH]|uniref:DUF3999 domain-containing protein n=1 Tax=Comamonas halotolerans TaxID=3041496 RepID=UPI0024E0A039|nr:DUF3999 domain-containing protein [Comamonas sp. NoAH]